MNSKSEAKSASINPDGSTLLHGEAACGIGLSEAVGVSAITMGSSFVPGNGNTTSCTVACEVDDHIDSTDELGTVLTVVGGERLWALTGRDDNCSWVPDLRRLVLGVDSEEVSVEETEEKSKRTLVWSEVIEDRILLSSITVEPP